MPDRSNTTLIYRRIPKNVRRQDLRDFVLTLESSVSNGRPFTCLLTGDEELQRLNKTFLRKDYPTDVLSFPEEAPDGFLGEIAISVDRAADQAREFGHSLEDEIRILLLHGVLHLLGMDHEKDRGKMARAESQWRKKLGLHSGLIERVRS
jgi:probable rRNA maturation factor